MRKQLVIILATLAVLALAVGCAKPQVEAPATKSAPAATLTTATTPPQSPTAFKASGTVERTAQVDNAPPTYNGSEFTYNKSITWEVSGDVDGVWLYKGTTAMLAISGHLTMDYDSTFTGAVKGKHGTFTAKVTGGSADNNAPTILTANIVSGTGELANLSGTITLNASQDGNRMTGTYIGVLDLGE